MAVLQPGAQLGPYRLGERISRGGMGEVWRAIKRGEGGWEKSIALKLILPTLDEERFADMFLAEARIAAALDHANIVPVFNFGREGALLYIEMEQVVGQDLRHILARARAPLPTALALFVVAEVLKGLAYAHERGVVHRDIKPHNTLVSYEGHVKLTDFGIAKLAAETGAGPSRSEVKGTAGYIAPEVLEGAPASVRSDLFAVGLLLWECLTGKKLFDGATEAERLKRTFDCRVPLLRQVVAGAPVALEELALRLLAREPSARHASAREALAALLAVPGARAASSEEMKQLLGRLFATEAAAAQAEAASASASLRAAGVGSASRRRGEVSASPGDGVPREILDDAPLMPGRTPTIAGEEERRAAPRVASAAVPAGGATNEGATTRGAGAGAAGASRRRPMWIVAGLAVVAAASVVAALGLKPRPRPAPVPPVAKAPVKAPTPAPAPAPLPPPAPEAASVVIEVTPPDARLLVDGRAIPGSSPFALAEVPRGRTLHVRVERDGFVAYEAPLLIDAPVVRLPVTLAPAEPPPPTAAPSTRTHHRAPTPAPQSEAPSPAAKPKPRKTPADDDGTMLPPPP